MAADSPGPRAFKPTRRIETEFLRISLTEGRVLDRRTVRIMSASAWRWNAAPQAGFSFANSAPLRSDPAVRPACSTRVERHSQHPAPMSDAQFPSGPWTGFYTYRPNFARRHGMDLRLRFQFGSVDGEGDDEVGPFRIRGVYKPADGVCLFVKSYLGGHSVNYNGRRDGKGIYGQWSIPPFITGGFHIWPLGADAEQREQTEEAVEPSCFLPDETTLDLPRVTRARLSSGALTSRPSSPKRHFFHHFLP
jgi:hypothetical protein